MIFLFSGCVDPYTPDGLKSTGALLVIDGFVDVLGVSTIKLSRSQSVTDDTPPLVETGATVWLEDEAGALRYFQEAGNGSYTLAAGSFTSAKYRLNIRTRELKEYVSDFEPVIISPAIDSVSWQLTAEQGVQLYVNTHDSEKSNRYYRWTFDETWLYTSAFFSTYVYNYTTNSVELRDDNIYHCWRNDQSSEILIESTVRLAENIVSQFPIQYIDQTSEKTRYKYSILVKQYGITEKALNYWQQLKKTTEDLGTLFGPLPTQVIGNYRCTTDPSESVIGYFAIGSVSTQRIFIPFTELPTPPVYDTPYIGCESYDLFNADVPNFMGPYLLTTSIPNPNGPGILGYKYSNFFCVDCRLSGGVNVKPDFWE